MVKAQKPTWPHKTPRSSTLNLGCRPMHRQVILVISEMPQSIGPHLIMVC